MQRLFNRIKSTLICFCLVLGFLLLGIFPAQAQVNSELPIAADSTGRQNPAWDRVSFSSLPAFDNAGVLNVPEDVTGYLDYNLSRSWQAGDSVLSVLKLGDVQDAFALGNFRLGDAVQLGGLDPATLSLSNFSFLKNENIADLVNLIPAIGEFKISEVRPLYDLMTQRIPNVDQIFSQVGSFRVWTEQPLSALAKLPEIGNLSLRNLDLSQYSFTQLPGLEQATLSSIRDWKNLNLAQIPGLGNVPFSAFFNPSQFFGLIAIHDVTYGGDTEHKESRWVSTHHSISGSYEVGFNNECAQARGCDYLELNSPTRLGSLGDPTGLHGARWMRGGKGAGEQMVKGGHGILGMLNGGKEPTGRHPFGKAFKVVLTDTDESTGTGKFGLYFRVCHHGFVDLGCTPYFIGPIPWFPTHEKGVVLVGLTEQAPPSNIPEPDVPLEVQQLIDNYDSTNNNEDSSGGIAANSECVGKAVAAAPGVDAPYAAKAIPALLTAAQQYRVTDPAQVAYILATAQAEVDFNPRNEDDSYSRSGACGNFCGRGLVQLTHQENYAKAGGLLGVDLVNHPEQANTMDLAAKISVLGMKQGWFTGRKLGDYIHGSNSDLVGARAIVNDSDRNGEIAGYAHRYMKALSTCTQSAGAGGGNANQIEQNIFKAAQSQRGHNSSNDPGTDGGENACAYEVNLVLQKAGISPLGSRHRSGSAAYVPDVVKDLDAGAGKRIRASQANPGDIAISAGTNYSSGQVHIGICMTAGCTQILSNSSSNHSFTWISDVGFDGESALHGGQTTIYRVIQ